MNIFDMYYTAIANRCDTDIDGAKEILKGYLKWLKKEIDESDDEFLKTRWNDEFGSVECPDIEDFIVTLLICGRNPFVFKKEKNKDK